MSFRPVDFIDQASLTQSYIELKKVNPKLIKPIPRYLLPNEKLKSLIHETRKEDDLIELHNFIAAFKDLRIKQ